MKLTSAGESHGKGLVGIIENMPSNLNVDIEISINIWLIGKAVTAGAQGRKLKKIKLIY